MFYILGWCRQTRKTGDSVHRWTISLTLYIYIYFGEQGNMTVKNPFQFVFREQGNTIVQITFQANGSNQTVSAWNKHCSTWFEPSFDDRTHHKPFTCPFENDFTHLDKPIKSFVLVFHFISTCSRSVPLTLWWRETIQSFTSAQSMCTENFIHPRHS